METQSKKRKLNRAEKSVAYFKLISEENSIKIYKCNECSKEVNGTKRSNLTSHLRCHPDIFHEAFRENQIIEEARLKLLLDCVELIGVNGRSFKCLTDSSIHSMNQKILRELKENGRELNLRDQNLFEVKDELMNISKQIHTKIGNEAQNRPISLMVDIVTKRSRSIFGMSIQYIINDTVKIRSIGMIELEDRHTGSYLADLIINRLKELGIHLKQLITITTDNGSNVLKMVRDIAEHLKESSEVIDPQTQDVLPKNVEELTDDETIALILKAAENEADIDEFEPNEDDLNSNQNLLNVIQNNMEKTHGMEFVFSVTGINCVCHTLQLAISDSINATTEDVRNLFSLCRCVSKHLRSYATICNLKSAGIIYNKPRIDVVTRWGSLFLMVNFIDIH